MIEQLEDWLRENLDDPSLEICGSERLSTGHSRAMYRLDLAAGRSLVLRVEQGGVFGTRGDEEYRVMAALGRAGVPVAPVLGAELTGELVGRPFFVMEFVPGDVQAREDRTLPADVAAALVRTLSHLHGLESDDVVGAFDVVPEPADATDVQIERWADIYRQAAGTPIPLLEEAAAWLHHHASPLERLGVVHADPGPGNLVHRDGRVVALTDWEFSHLGDPMEDWVYLVSMRGARTMPSTAWLELFAQEAGVEITPWDMHYWRVFNFFKGACANRTALEVFRGPNQAPNLAIIGTALHQNFLRQASELVAARGPGRHTAGRA